jgi:hypothetical protein
LNIESILNGQGGKGFRPWREQVTGPVADQIDGIPAGGRFPRGDRKSENIDGRICVHGSRLDDWQTRNPKCYDAPKESSSQSVGMVIYQDLLAFVKAIAVADVRFQTLSLIIIQLNSPSNIPEYQSDVKISQHIVNSRIAGRLMSLPASGRLMWELARFTQARLPQ